MAVFCIMAFLCDFPAGFVSDSPDQGRTLLTLWTPRKLHITLMTKHTSVCKQQAGQRLRQTQEESPSWEELRYTQAAVRTLSEQLNASHACPVGSIALHVYTHLIRLHTYAWKGYVTFHVFWVSILEWHMYVSFQHLCWQQACSMSSN